MPYYYFYWGSAILLIPGILFSIYASIRVNTTFKKYDKVSTQRGESANAIAHRLLEQSGCNVNIISTSGHLTDHYNPKNNTLALSQSTRNSCSVSAIAVASHEVGHATQHKDGHFLLKLRIAIVPVVNVGTYLAFPLAILGVLLEYFSLTTIKDLGSILIVVGIVLYSLSSLFALITLPVEINASSRALKMLTQGGYITPSEKGQMRYVLYTAALTYVASLVTSLLYLFRFILILSSFRKKD